MKHHEATMLPDASQGGTKDSVCYCAVRERDLTEASGVRVTAGHSEPHPLRPLPWCESLSSRQQAGQGPQGARLSMLTTFWGAGGDSESLMGTPATAGLCRVARPCGDQRPARLTSWARPVCTNGGAAWGPAAVGTVTPAFHADHSGAPQKRGRSLHRAPEPSGSGSPSALKESWGGGVTP